MEKQISLGMMRINNLSIDELENLINEALNQNITLFDHANIYGNNKCEELFGEVLKRNIDLRKRMIIQSKCGICNGYYDSSKEHIIDETLKSNRMLQVAQEINARKKDVKIVLVAGPSSSGKTTSSRKLCMYLQSFGLTPKVISMDDYFVERDQTPLDEDGKPDYECLEAMDVKLFDKQMAALLKGEKVTVPTFNFAAGIKEFKNEMQFADDDIMIIEGIHALDDKILTNIDRKKKYKIYISALTEINMDDHNRICTSDNRLLRRIIRDNRTRGYGVDHTLKLWPSVRRGEEKYIFPFQDDADATINSALIYEIGVLKTYVEPLLYSVDSDSPYYEEAKRLINFLRLFLPIPADAIPADSILREFIGGSYFHE